MKEIRTVDGVGHVLCHDMTQIIPGVIKDARFRKGHVVTQEDIPVLLSLGKEHLYVWEADEGKYHEDEAAEILCGLCLNDHMERSQVKEGKIEIRSILRGLLKIEVGLLDTINGMGGLMIASRHSNTTVDKGDKLCATRIIPLVIEKERLAQAEEVCQGKKIFSLLPFGKKRIGIVTTGSEVFYGRIKDGFGPVIKKKVDEFEGRVMGQSITDDDPEHTKNAILDFLQKGADMVLVSGGMSVDPDDKTPLAIRSTGAAVVSYGAPVLPGAMFLLSYYERNGKRIPIAGLPGCVMYEKRTVLDLVLPRLMADDPVTKEELDHLGRGGLCLSCDVCTFPNCGFGKGW